MDEPRHMIRLGMTTTDTIGNTIRRTSRLKLANAVTLNK